MKKTHNALMLDLYGAFIVTLSATTIIFGIFALAVYFQYDGILPIRESMSSFKIALLTGSNTAWIPVRWLTDHPLWYITYALSFGLYTIRLYELPTDGFGFSIFIIFMLFVPRNFNAASTHKYTILSNS